MTLKLGSLFDGSGGFPLAGTLCGITPAWASEVEPYPIAVTRSRFPGMKHLGSVTDIHGWEIEPVDIIIFGSPCQDLSVAGKRAGLKHEVNGDEETTRSGLFMEAVRIIKEMREATDGKYPRFAVWENVPGAFSSNSGGDFRVVLEELIKIVEPTATVPTAPKGGWPYADAYMGDGWSLAYRVFDAQYWGVPQRRRRIFLVADFVGGCAPGILFKREGLRGYPSQGGSARQGAAAYAQGCAEADDREGNCLIPWEVLGLDGYNSALTGDVSATLGVNCGISTGRNGVVVAAGFKAGNGSKANGIGWQEDKSPTLSAASSGTNQAPTVCVKTWDTRGNGDGETVSTITGDHENRITDYSSIICMATQQGGAEIMVDKCPTITASAGMSGNNQPIVAGPCHCLQGNGIDRADTAGCNGKGWREDISYTLNTIDRHAVAYCIGNGQLNQIGMNKQSNTLDCMHDKQAILIFDKEVYNSGKNANGGHYIAEDGPAPTLRTSVPPGVCLRYIVRRLTPTECARLQGFPDNWGHPDLKEDFTDEEYQFWLNVRNTHAEINGKTVKDYTKAQMLKWYNKLHSNSSEYKMWGNGIALPCALYVMEGFLSV